MGGRGKNVTDVRTEGRTGQGIGVGGLVDGQGGQKVEVWLREGRGKIGGGEGGVSQTSCFRVDALHRLPSQRRQAPS